MNYPSLHLSFKPLFSISLITLLFFLLSGCSARNSGNEMITIKNFYQVSDKVYRSAQPSPKGMKQLEEAGINTVINLRLMHSDRDEAENTALNLVWLPMRAGNITDNNMVKILQAITQSDTPVLVHCWHGSDRTGTAIAMYRIVIQNWTKEEAIKELRQPQYGYHANFYPNIITYLENVDIEKIRAQVFEPQPIENSDTQ